MTNSLNKILEDYSQTLPEGMNYGKMDGYYSAAYLEAAGFPIKAVTIHKYHGIPSSQGPYPMSPPRPMYPFNAPSMR